MCKPGSTVGFRFLRILSGNVTLFQDARPSYGILVYTIFEQEGCNMKHNASRFSRFVGGIGLTVLSCLVVAPVQATEPAVPSYQLLTKIAIGGEGGWDYLTVDSGAHRLYVTRGTHVMVIDTEKNAVVGDIPNTPGVHGVAIAPKLGRGYTQQRTRKHRLDLRPQIAQRAAARCSRAESGRHPLRFQHQSSLYLQRPAATTLPP